MQPFLQFRQAQFFCLCFCDHPLTRKLLLIRLPLQRQSLLFGLFRLLHHCQLSRLQPNSKQ